MRAHTAASRRARAWMAPQLLVVGHFVFRHPRFRDPDPPPPVKFITRLLYRSFDVTMMHRHKFYLSCFTTDPVLTDPLNSEMELYRRLDAPPTIGEDSKGAASTLRNRLKNAARIPVRHDSDGM